MSYLLLVAFLSLYSQNSQMCYMALRDIKVGEVIDMNNVAAINPDNGCEIITNSIFNLETKRLIKKGSYIKREYLKEKIIIKSGEKVKAYFVGEGLKIGISLMALKNGKKGDVISLYDRNSNKTYYGKVVDFKKVEIINMEER